MCEPLLHPTGAAHLMSIDNRVITHGDDKGLTHWQAEERRRLRAQAVLAWTKRPPPRRDHRAAMARLADCLRDRP